MRKFICVSVILIYGVFLFFLAGCAGKSSSESEEVKLVSLEPFFSLKKTANRAVTIVAAGDVNFGDGVTPILSQMGIFWPWEDVNETFSSADIAFVNLECAVSSKGYPVAGKEFTFRGPVDSVKGLKKAGVDVVSLANNHSKDYGKEALVDTMANLAANQIAWCGAGNDLNEAYYPAVLDIRGNSVAFLAFTSIVPAGWTATEKEPGCAITWNRKKVLEAIQRAKKNHDFVVVSYHWGVELATSPNGEQVSLAKLSIDSGADLVLGHHPHVAQGLQLYKNRLIAYSLGNFIFSPPREISSKTLLLSVLLDEKGVVQAKITPVRIRSCKPIVMRGDEAVTWLSVLKDYSAPLGTDLKISGAYGYIDARAANVSQSR